MNNDFHSSHGIFDLFNGLEVTGMDDKVGAASQMNGNVTTNGNHDLSAQLNGNHKPSDPNVFNEVNQ